MTAAEMIERYALFHRGGRIGSQNMWLVNKDNAIPMIKEHKDEIIKELDRRIEMSIRRDELIDEIEGLKEIRKAMKDLLSWHREFEASFDDVGGMGVRNRPQYDIAAMRKEYPRADAYLRAEVMAAKANYSLAAAGKKAMDMVIFGDYQEANKYMDEQNRKFVEQNCWN